MKTVPLKCVYLGEKKLKKPRVVWINPDYVSFVAPFIRGRQKEERSTVKCGGEFFVVSGRAEHVKDWLEGNQAVMP